jgi:hypothetical protein
VTDPQTPPVWATTTASEPWDPELEPDAQQHQFVFHDLFPARVCGTAARTFNAGECWRGKTRVIVTTTHAFFFTEVPEYPGIGLLHKEEYVSTTGGQHDDGGVLLEFADYSVRLLPDRGCGCGSRLRNLRPFPQFSMQSRD